MSDSSLQQNAVSWHQVICFLSSCNYTNDVNEIHKIFIEWGIECMGNNTQLHHFTNYQSVVFIRCLYFYSGFIVLSFHQTSPTNSTRKTFLLKSLSYAPQCLHLFGSPRNLFFLLDVTFYRHIWSIRRFSGERARSGKAVTWPPLLFPQPSADAAMMSPRTIFGLVTGPTAPPLLLTWT